MNTQRQGRTATTRVRLQVGVVAAAVFALALTLLVAPAANASTRTPLQPKNVHIAAVTSTSFTVTAPKSKYAKKYAVFTSKTKSSLALNKIKHVLKSKKFKSPTVTINIPNASAGTYYYRLAAYNGRKVRYSSVYSVGLLPPKPAGFKAVNVGPQASTGQSTTLTLIWGGATVASYVVQQATNPSFSGAVSYSIGGHARQFTPPGLNPGTQYWFRIRSINGGTGSAFTGAVTGVTQNYGMNVRVLTYNLLRATSSGQLEGGGGRRVAAWADRVGPAAALVKSASPDIISVQEGSDWANPNPPDRYCGPRQIDSLVSELNRQEGSSIYRVANTEPVCSPYGGVTYLRTGRYLVYNTDRFTAIGNGGYWMIGAQLIDGVWQYRYAAYQELRDNSTGGRFLAVAVHLQVGSTAQIKANRVKQVQTLLKDAADLNGRLGNLPVFFAGDYNSYPDKLQVLDGPGKVMQSALMTDASDAAQTKVNAQYNSVNQYMLTAPKMGMYTDHIFVARGIAVTKWAMLLKLNSNGQFAGTLPSDHNPVYADLTIPIS